MKVGDFVQYRSAMGVIMGYGLVVGFNGCWIRIQDNATGKDEYWSEHLMRKVM